MPDIIITPSTGKLEFIDNSAQTIRRHSFTLDHSDGLVLDAPLSAAAISAPLNVINVTVNNSNANYPFVLAQSGETGAKNLLMDGAGGTYNPFTNTATIDISGNSATTTLASNSTNLGGVAAASYVTLTGTQTLTNKTITGTFTGNLTGTGSWATNAVSAISATTATNATQLNGQAASYYTNIPARLGYTPVNQAGDTISGNLTVNGNFAVNGSVTAFSASNIYITSSNLTVTDNILLMNALSPYQRYAGIQMYDSGSGTLSQLLWDGDGDYFFLTGSSVNGKIITGPDAQANLTSGYIPKATAGYKLGNSLIYDNGSNVGIGNTSPTAKLTVVNTERILGILRAESTPRTTFYDNAFAVANDGGGANGFIYTSGTGGTYPLDFYGELILQAGPRTGYNNGISLVTGTTSPSVKLRIAENGNVGIGTTSPQYPLDISGSNIRSFSTAGGAEPGFIADYPSSNGYGGFFIHVNNTRRWRIGSVGDTNVQPALNFWQEGTGSRMIIGNNGNVGIGTTAPSYKFQVNGGQFGTSLKGGDLGAGSEVVRMIKSDDTYAMVVRGDGYVGIGTNSPSNKTTIEADTSGASFADNNVGQLVIRGATNTAKRLGLGIDTTNNIGVIQAQLYGTGQYPLALNPAGGSVGVGVLTNLSTVGVGSSAATTLGLLRTGVIAVGGNIGPSINFYLAQNATTSLTGDVNLARITTNPIDNWGGRMLFLTKNADANNGSAPTEKMRLTEDGNLGIGTTSPLAMVHVESSNSQGDNKGLIYLKSTSGTNVLKIGVDGTNNFSELRAYTPGAGDNSKLILQPYGGNVGIGTTNPIYKFQVVGSAYVNNGTLYIDSGNSLTWGNSTQSILGTNDVGLSFTAGSTTRMFISSSGNIGIGTTIPAYKLHVVGDIYANGGSFRISGNNGYYFESYGGGWYMSDSTWIRSISDKNVWVGTGLLGAQGGLTVGYGGASPTSLGAIISGSVGIGTSSPTAKVESYYSSNAITFNYLATNLNNSSPIPVYGFDVTNGSGETRSIKAGIGYERHEPNGRGTMHFYNDSTNDTQSLVGTRLSPGDIKMSINNAGSVGIGTTQPSWLLTVYASTTPQFTLQNGTRSFVLTNNSLDSLLSFNYGSVNRLQFDTTNQWFNTGNLGVGNTSPQYKLHVTQATPSGQRAAPANTSIQVDSNTNNYISFVNTADNGTYAGLTFVDNNIGGYIVFRNYTGDVTTGSDSLIYGTFQDHIFQNSSSETINGKTETMRIKQNGNVGIGSNNPQYKLDVNGVLAFGGVAVLNTANNGNDIYANVRVIRNTSSTSADGMYINYDSAGTTAAHLRFYANAGNERMRIQANDGNVGIGTTSAGRRLDVEGVVRTRGASGTGGFEISAATTGTAKWRIEWDSASDSLDFNWVG